MFAFPRKTKFSLNASALLLLVTMSPAYAGFEWTSPPKVSEQKPAEIQMQNPGYAGPLTPEPEVALPIPVEAVETKPVDIQPVVIEEPKMVEKSKNEASVSQDPLPTPAPEIIEDKADIIEGFGKDIPLAIALRDIVPATYAYQFHPSEVAGLKISWRGGKPWTVVLKEALVPHGLETRISGNVLSVSYTNFVQPEIHEPIATATSHPENSKPVPLAIEKQAQSAEVRQAPIAQEEAPIQNSAFVVDMNKKSKWEARSGETVRQALEAWTKTAKVELQWSTAYDYPVQSSFYFEGNFAEAVDSLLSAYKDEPKPPKGRLYPNLPDGPSVLMIN